MRLRRPLSRFSPQCQVLRPATKSQRRVVLLLLSRVVDCQVINQFRLLVRQPQVDGLPVLLPQRFALLVSLFAQVHHDATTQVRCAPSFFVFVRRSPLVLRVRFAQRDMRRIPSQRCDSQAYANKHDRDRSQELLSLHDQARDDRVSPKLIHHDNLPTILRDRQWRRDLNG